MSEELGPRAALRARLEELGFPAGWRFIADERTVDPQAGTTVQASLRTFRRHPVRSSGIGFQLEYQVTVTVPGESLIEAEDRLDDAMLEWLVRLDDSDIPWSGDWTKANYDGRLGYQGSIFTDALRKED